MENGGFTRMMIKLQDLDCYFFQALAVRSSGGNDCHKQPGSMAWLPRAAAMMPRRTATVVSWMLTSTGFGCYSNVNKRPRDSRIEALTHLPTPCVRTTISTRAAARSVLSFLSRANCSSQSRTLPSLVSQSKDTVYAVGGVQQEKL